MPELSPAAQAVRRDLSQIMHEMSQRCRVSISATDTLPITLETNDASLQAGINSLCAAALEALADQVVPEGRALMIRMPEADVDGNELGGMLLTAEPNDRIRLRILRIAAELEG